MDVSLGSDVDLDDYVELLEEAGAWLLSRGLPQWPPGSIRAQASSLRSQLCARDTAGTLVVARSEAGKGLGARLVRRAEDWSARVRSQAAATRLLGGNDTLRAYYRELGFAELDVVTEGTYLVRLFEKGLR